MTVHTKRLLHRKQRWAQQYNINNNKEQIIRTPYKSKTCHYNKLYLHLHLQHIIKIKMNTFLAYVIVTLTSLYDVDSHEELKNYSK